MMKNRLFSYCFLCAIFLFVATGLSSCTSDSQTEDGYNNIKQSFENMKGSYEGTAVMNDNSNHSTLDFTIDQQANVTVKNFPIELVLQKVYPSDYQNIQGETEGFSYTAAIDSVGVPSVSALNWKTKNIDVTFNYKKDGSAHAMMLTLATTGYYDVTRNLLSLRIDVEDLIVDNQDMTRFLPITFTVDAAGKK